MWLNLTGAALITAAGAALGYLYAAADAGRLRELLECKKALLILASEVEFTAAPLPEAARNIANRTEGSVSRLFGDYAEGLAAGENDTAYRLWEAAAERHKPSMYLKAADWDALAGLGKTLGYLDRQMQLNAIRFTVEYIDHKTAELRENSAQNRRMYRGLGVIGGLLLAVLLW